MSLRQNTMMTAELALRPGEWAYYAEEEPSLPQGQYYAVALVETPAPPGDAHPECRTQTVVVMQLYKTIKGKRAGEILWGWVHLTEGTRKWIGEDLKIAKAVVGRWYYLIPSFELPKASTKELE